MFRAAICSSERNCDWSLMFLRSAILLKSSLVSMRYLSISLKSPSRVVPKGINVSIDSISSVCCERTCTYDW